MRLFFTKTLPVCLLGLLAGLLNGLLGAGGGIVIVLGLKKLLENRLQDKRAIYASALAVMLPLSLISVWRYARMGHIADAELQSIILPTILGGAIGAFALRRFSPRALGRLFSALVLVSGLIMVF